jgi:hypothetical protein
MSSVSHPAGDDVIALANGIDGCQARKHDKCSIDHLSARPHGIHDEMNAYGDECIQHNGREKTEYGLPHYRQRVSECFPGFFDVHGLSVCCHKYKRINNGIVSREKLIAFIMLS